MRRHAGRTALAVSLLTLAIVAGPGFAEKKPNPLRNAYFGDLHVHTKYSLDAYVLQSMGDPDRAYRFAQGEPIPMTGGGTSRITVPLDFAAVTDHAEWLGEVGLVMDKSFAPRDPKATAQLARLRGSRAKHDSDEEAFMDWVVGSVVNPDPKRRALAGPGGEDARRELRTVWSQVIKTADRHYKPGKFTTFVAYEWTGTPNNANLHRNVIFRANSVPSTPCSFYEAATVEQLWDWMEQTAGGAENVLAIPHNTNLSMGLAFRPAYSDGRPLDRAYAARRELYEPLVEIFQAKGGSEVHPLPAAEDEFADFEKLPPGGLGNAGEGEARAIAYSFVRDGLKEGLRQAERVGVNPFGQGVIGSTDTHSGNPGDTEEFDWRGNHAAKDNTPPRRLHGSVTGVASMVNINPGGLAGIWAEENTRGSLFDAMRRKETFATSGTRIKVRFFASWGYTPRMVNSREFVKLCYRNGVPMGADLPPRPDNAKAPTFLVSALRDPHSGNLDRIQIVKGWTRRGQVFERIHNVALSDGRKVDPKTGRAPAVGNTVDLKTGTYTNDIGAVQLTAWWRDPDFDPSVRAFYYVRVLEIPTPRWSTLDAIRLGEAPPKDKPATIQERAWTSAIWYTPGGKDVAARHNEAGYRNHEIPVEE